VPKLNIHSIHIASANTLLVEVGTNCPQGGDGGHGGRTVLRLSDGGGTAMKCRVNDGALLDADKIEIVLSGDSECETFTQALEFALAVLRSKSDLFGLKTTEEDVD